MIQRKIWAGLMAAGLLAMMLSGCNWGKNGGADGGNIVPRSTEAGIEGQKNYDVLLDERPEEERYLYSMDDLSLVDTISGKKITIGMSRAEIETITGEAVATTPRYCLYDGVVVQYTEEDIAGALVVSGGEFREEEAATKYLTVRGVGLYTSFEDFVKAYGEEHFAKEEEEAVEGEMPSETPARAIRYFRIDGRKVEYLGTVLTEEMEQEGEENLYIQDFVFGRETNQITAMRISRIDMLGR